MLKKVMSAVLAGVMTLALAVPAFASTLNASNPYSTTPNSGEVEAAWYTNNANGSGAYISADASGDGLQRGEFTTRYTSETKVPYLDVLITGNGGLILNPYRVEYNTATVGWGGNPSAAWDLAANVPSATSVIPPSSAAVDTPLGADQIISTDITITSRTLVPVLVGAKVKAEVKQGVANPGSNGVTLAASVVAADQTKSVKKVCLWLGAGATHNEAVVNGRNALNSKAAADSNNCKQWLLCSQATVDGATATNQIKWNNNERIYMIPKSTGAANDAKTCVLNFGGQMVQQPLNNPWVPGDKITPTLVIDLQVQKNMEMPVYS